MLNDNSNAFKTKVEAYLIECARDYAEKRKGKGLTADQIKKFVINDIVRVKGYTARYGLMPFQSIIDYLKDLALAVDFTYYDDFNRLANWYESGKIAENATNKEFLQADKKYWYFMAKCIDGWFEKLGGVCIVINFNNEQLKSLGLNFENDRDALLYVFKELEWLESHNKNLTNNQYNKIDTLKDIFSTII